MNDTESPAHEPASEIEIIAGGVTITVRKIDGSQEQVKVRQLPMRLVPEWAALQGQEADLVELLCDKQDRSAQWRLRNARMSEERLLQLLRNASAEQVPPINEQLRKLRAEIDEIEAGEHWSDGLTEESMVEILKLGEQLNRPRFGRWAKRRAEATGRMMKETQGSLSGNSPLAAPSFSS